MISLSDVTDGIGSRLFLDGANQPVRMGMTYEYQWPNQGLPTPSDWKFWIHALKATFARSGMSLTTSLGPWIQQVEDYPLVWTEFMDNDGYRVELGGILGLLVILCLLEELFPPDAPYDVVIACDGKSALFKALSGDREYFNTSSSSFDLLSRVILLQERLRAHLIPTHVKGHQDGHRRSLTELEVLNV